MMLDSSAIARLVIISGAAFLFGVVVMPLWIAALRRWKFGKNIRDAASAPVMAKLHAAKVGTPTAGGLVIWVAVAALAAFARSACALKIPYLCQLSFLSRAQTRLPLGILVAAGLLGLWDDWLNIKKIGPKGGGLRMRYRLISYAAIAMVGAWWFYSRLQWDFLHIPFYGTWHIGLWYVPVFAFITIATSFSVNETDGLDGLAGGPLVAAFGAMAVIAWSQGRVDLAALCGAILGALLAFLWFNVPPASVFMGDTGAMSLGSVLAAVAMITNTALLLPIIGLPFVIESLSVIIQLTSKKLFKRKIFLSSPLHHHLEAKGWAESKIVMRTWIISLACAAIGVIIAFADPTR
jgi:phospho-N-acetylmuramoyl-pentapeptide-transferase